jgi:hypothetical protein
LPGWRHYLGLTEFARPVKLSALSAGTLDSDQADIRVDACPKHLGYRPDGRSERLEL